MFSTPEEWYDVCVVKKKEGDIPGAIILLHQLLEKYPDYTLAYAALCAWYKQNNEADKAIEYGKLYCGQAPNDPFGFSILSLLYIKQGLRVEAEEALMKARDLRIAAELEKQTEDDT